MKRSTALNEIRIAGYDGDTEKAALIAAKQGIGQAAARKAYADGQKLKRWGEPRPDGKK